MPAGAGPECRVGVLQILRHLGGRDRGAKDHRAGRRRIAVADDALSHIRSDAVGADQRRGHDPFAAVQRDRHAGVLRIEIHARGSRCEARSVRARGRRRAARRGCRRDAPPRKDCRSARRTASPHGMLATSSPVTASIIRSRSISSACFLAAAPTPSASSTDSALGATWRPTPTSPNSRACSSTSERKPWRASASAQASPPMPPPAMATGCALRADVIRG